MIKDSQNGTIATTEGTKLNTKPKRPTVQDIQDEAQQVSCQAQSVAGNVLAEFDAQINQGEEAIASYVEERVIRMPYQGIAAGLRRVAGGDAGDTRPFQFMQSLSFVPDLEGQKGA